MSDRGAAVFVVLIVSDHGVQRCTVRRCARTVCHALRPQKALLVPRRVNSLIPEGTGAFQLQKELHTMVKRYPITRNGMRLRIAVSARHIF